MKKKKVLQLLTLATVAALTLTACGNGGGKNDKKNGQKENKETETTDASKFPVKVSNNKKALDKGEMDVAVATDTQFQGLFLWELYEDNYDARFMEPSHEQLFTTDKDFVITDDGPAKLELDVDKKTATITLQEKDMKWSDGEPVTSDDLIYPYEIIGHKDYTGVRYDDYFTNIVGIEEYNAGKAKTISGIKKVDDQSIEITYKEMNPGMQQAGGSVWGYAAPKHALKDIPVKDLASSDPVRKNPVTFGPYKMNKIKAGESVEYVPNEYYYKGKPKLDKITFTSVPQDSIVEALKSKKYDTVISMPTDTYTAYKDTEGYEMLGRKELAYTYLGFKQGKWDAEKKEVVPDPDAKLADKNLRQAMGYAVNNDEVGEKFYNGLRSNATTLIPPVFESFHDSKVKGYTQDKDKAKKLLADAGYKDTDGDGLVEDKDGKKLTLKFASMAGGETAQPLADYYIQEWKDIGLDVELATGRLIDFQAFYDKLKNDDPGVDVFQGAWGTGSDPSPTGLYGRNSMFNYTRFADEKNDKLLKAIDSNKSFDPEYRKKAFSDWQEYASKEAFVIPTLYRNEILPVSKRVTGLDWSNEVRDTDRWFETGVSEKDR